MYLRVLACTLQRALQYALARAAGRAGTRCGTRWHALQDPVACAAIFCVDGIYNWNSNLCLYDWKTMRIPNFSLVSHSGSLVVGLLSSSRLKQRVNDFMSLL